MCTIVSTNLLFLMKVLASSSPYATFIARDWNSSINSSHLVDPSSKARIKKRYYKNFVKFEIQEDSNPCLQKSKNIQLSFA